MTATREEVVVPFVAGGARAVSEVRGTLIASSPRSGGQIFGGRRHSAYARAVASWFVYVAECADGSLYTGIARDVAARLAAHDAGRGAKYTRGRGPLRLLAARRCKSEGNALRLERAVKALSREKKRALVASVDAFGALARRVTRAASRR